MRVVCQLAPRIGEGTGVGAVAYGLARAFAAKGVSVEEFTLDDTPYRRIPTPSALSRHLEHVLEVVYFSTVGSARARARLRREPDTWSICHNDLLAGDIYVNHGLLRVAMESRNHPHLRMLRNPLHLFTQARDWWRFSFSHVHQAVVHLTQAERDTFQRLYPRCTLRSAVIGNGVDTTYYRVPSDQEHTSARDHFKLPADAFVVGFAGHEFGRKGLALLIDALPSLPERVHLLVTGGRPEDIDQARRHARAVSVLDRVTFAGVQSDSRATLWASDVLALPSSYESYSLILLEALACGTPAVHTRVGAATELIEPGVNGFLVERDVPQLVDAILAVTELDTAKSRVAARSAALPHDWSIVADQYLQLLADLHAESRTIDLSVAAE